MGLETERGVLPRVEGEMNWTVGRCHPLHPAPTKGRRPKRRLINQQDFKGQSAFIHCVFPMFLLATW